MLQYEIICHAQHIPAYPTDRHKDLPVSIRAWTGWPLRLWRVLSERVPRDSQTSAVSDSVRSNSNFAGSVPARNTCFAPVAARHDMTACLCVSLFIGRGVLDEHAYAGSRGWARGLVGYHPPWTLPRTAQTSLSWCHAISQDHYCVSNICWGWLTPFCSTLYHIFKLTRYITAIHATYHVLGNMLYNVLYNVFSPGLQTLIEVGLLRYTACSVTSCYATSHPYILYDTC